MLRKTGTPMAEVSAALGEMLAEHGGDRHQIADRASEILGRRVSKYMLDAWSAISREGYNIPFYAAHTVEQVVGDHRLTRWHLEKMGAIAVWPWERDHARLQHLLVERARLEEEIQGIFDRAARSRQTASARKGRKDP